MSTLRLAALGLVAAVGSGITGSRAADEPRVDLPGDLVYQRSADSPGPVVFRHWTHVALQGDRCDGCHPGLFHLVYPDRAARHERMDAGGGCGSCHDGRRAFATGDSDACLDCHDGESRVGPLPPAPEGRLLGSSTLHRSPDSPGPVRFDHAPHLTAGAVCSDCHPKLAAMRAGALRASKEQMLAGGSCGACHDGARAFAVDDERCERCHGEEER